MESNREREPWLEALRGLPAGAREVAGGLSESQLDTPYRPGGWTVRQVLHHLADAHMNGAQRMRLVLTEHRPVLRHYDQDAWAALPDARGGPPEESLQLLEAVHARMVRLLEAQEAPAFERVGLHPEVGELSLHQLVRTYAEHGEHHLGQIRGLRSERGW